MTQEELCNCTDPQVERAFLTVFVVLFHIFQLIISYDSLEDILWLLWNAHSSRSHNCFSLESFVHSGYFTCTCTAKFQILGRRLCSEFKLILIRFLLCIFSSIRLYTKCVTTKDCPIWFFQGRHQCRLLVIKIFGTDIHLQ